MVKDKGIEELVEAFKTVNEKNPDARLLLVGPFERDLDPLSIVTENETKHNPNIIHINWSNEVEYYMSFATLLVHPSHREGFPNVLLQAGAMACPIVCSIIHGNIDIVEDGKTGVHFKVQDVQDITEKIQFAINNPTILEKYANTLVQEIYIKYEREQVHKMLLNKYLELTHA